MKNFDQSQSLSLELNNTEVSSTNLFILTVGTEMQSWSPKFLIQSTFTFILSLFFFTEIKIADYTLPDDGRVSEDTKSLIRKLLITNPKERMTASQVKGWLISEDFLISVRSLFRFVTKLLIGPLELPHHLKLCWSKQDIYKVDGFTLD